MRVEKVALCTGSGGSLISEFFSSGADVFLTGDVKYHEARDVETAGRGVIDAGHFPTEHIMVNDLADRLREGVRKAGFDVAVDAWLEEKDPFFTL